MNLNELKGRTVILLNEAAVGADKTMVIIRIEGQLNQPLPANPEVWQVLTKDGQVWNGSITFPESELARIEPPVAGFTAWRIIIK